MTKYRKKSVEVDAMQWDGGNVADIWEWGGETGIHLDVDLGYPRLFLTTIHGEQAVARVGDWVVAEPVPDRFYPCKPDVFDANYEAVEG